MTLQILAFSFLKTITLSLDKETVHFSLLTARSSDAKIKGTSENKIRSLIYYLSLMPSYILS